MAHEPRRTGPVALVAMGAAALVALALLLVFGVFGQLPERTAPGTGVTAPPPAVASATAPEAPAAPIAGETDGDIPLTKLPLRLVATVVRENRRLSLATIEHIGEGGHQVMNEGETFLNHPRARLASIERGRVLIDNDGVREQLVIDRNPHPTSADALTSTQREQRRDLSRRLRALTDAGEDYREVLGRGERSGLLTQGQVSPVYEDGQLIGVQVDDIREGGVYAQIGLRDGDVVTAVNGISLAEPTAAAQVLAELAGSDVLEVDVERADGTEELLSMPTGDFTGAIDELE